MSKVPYTKTVLSYTDQLLQLKNRGLVIANEPKALHLLEVLSSLYSNLISGKDKRDIAGYFGLTDSVLSSWLHSIVYLRNICAHHSRLWNREMRIQPIVPRSPRNPFINQTTYILPEPGLTKSLNNKTYFIVSMIIYLMNTINPKHKVQAKFNALLAKYPNIDVRAMGFPDNWQTETLWQ